MAKKVLFDQAAKDSLKEGLNVVADAVGSTMGPDGKTVVISHHYNLPPIVTKDGVTVASSIILDDEVENVGAQIIKIASQKTLKDAGDGTTQTAVLAQAFVNEGMEAISNGANPQKLKKNIDVLVGKIVESLEKFSIKIAGDNQKIRQVATISANNDEQIGQLIADAYAKIGDDGLLLIEDSGTIETSIETVEGVEIPRGYMSPEFVTDKGKMQTVFENPYFLVLDYTVPNMKELIPFLTAMNDQGKLSRGLVIVAHDFEGEAYSSLVMNHRQGQLKCCLVKAPSTYRREHLEDIAIITGGKVIRDQDGLKIESARPEHVGSSDKVIISEHTMLIVGGKYNFDEYTELTTGIQVQIEGMKKDELKAVWERRLARLKGSIGIIKVGGSTDLEIKEKKDRVDDACRAVKSAIEEGVVPGGGTALIRAMDSLPMVEDDDMDFAMTIINSVCTSPLQRMLYNSGQDQYEIIDEVLRSEGWMGYNIRTNTMENLLDAGVIDPAKVVRVALQNAASVAGSVLTSDCLLVEVKPKE